MMLASALSRAMQRQLTISASSMFASSVQRNALPQPSATPSPWLVASSSALHTSATMERARRATRIRKRKVELANRKKKEERLRKNPPPLPKKVVLMLRSKGYWRPGMTVRVDESRRSFPTNDVFHEFNTCYVRYEFEDAVKELRYCFDPSLLDRPDDFITAKIEFDMSIGKSQAKFADEFKKMIPVPYPYDPNMPNKEVLAFVPNDVEKEKALKAGAKDAGGLELIEDIAKGRYDIAEIDHFVCHEDMMLHMKSVAGMLREKTPRKNEGTVGSDLVRMVRTFKLGIEVEVRKIVPALGYEKEPDYAFAVVPFGRLSQDVKELRENLDCILQHLMENKARKAEAWITRVILQLRDSPPSTLFSIRHSLINDKKLKEHLDAQKAREKAKAQKI